MTTTLHWVANVMAEVHRDAAATAPGIDVEVNPQLAALRAITSVDPVRSSEPARPGRPEIAALRASGKPWHALGDLAAPLAEAASNLEQIARRLLYPDEAMRWRLFHLACLGLTVEALIESRCSVQYVRPIGIGSGPVIRATDPRGEQWDLWFEAAGIWTHYSLPSPYVAATAGLPGAGQPLGADFALINRNRHALLIECKYSPDPTYVGRNGYEQALCYLAEARTGLAKAAAAAVIGPDEVVRHVAETDTAVGRVSIGPPSTIRDLVANALSA